MRKPQTFFVLLFLLSGIVFAQEKSTPLRFSFYGGISLPQGDFSGSYSDKAGYANYGYGVMAEVSKKLNGSLHWISSFSFLTNAFDNETLQDQLSGIIVKADKYLTTWMMSGLGFESSVSANINVYGLGQIGMLFSRYPDITFSTSREALVQTTSLGKAFAIGFGAGLIMDIMNFGFRYYYGEPEYKHVATYNGQTESVHSNLPVTIVQFYYGFNF